MRDFFINAFEKLVGVVVVILSLLVVIGAVAVMVGGGGPMGPGGREMTGVIPGLLFLLGGAIYVIFVGGLMYLGLGIYQNTKRSAELLERMAQK